MLNLNELVNETYAQFLREQADADAAQESAKRRAEADGLAAFQTALETELGADFLAALGVRYEPTKMSGKPSGVAKWTDTESDTAWSIMFYNGSALSGWKMFAQARQAPRAEVFSHTTGAGNLRDTLLVGIGTARAWAVKQAEASAKRLAEAQRIEADTAAREREARQQRAAQEAAAVIADQEIRAELATMVASAPPRWTWKAGATLTLYVMTWVCGAAITDEGDPTFDYDEAYTATDALDAGGYITVRTRYNEAREIKLDPRIHKPIWERITAQSVADLPSELTVMQKVHLKGVYAEYDYSSDTAAVLRYGYAEDAESFVLADVALLPVAWVRDLVDAL